MGEDLKLSRDVNSATSLLQRNQENALRRGSAVMLVFPTCVVRTLTVVDYWSAALSPVGRSAWIHTKVVTSRLRAEVPFEVSYFVLSPELAEQCPGVAGQRTHCSCFSPSPIRVPALKYMLIMCQEAMICTVANINLSQLRCWSCCWTLISKEVFW